MCCLSPAGKFAVSVAAMSSVVREEVNRMRRGREERDRREER
jgi:hypothetical protein